MESQLPHVSRLNLRLPFDYPLDQLAVVLLGRSFLWYEPLGPGAWNLLEVARLSPLEGSPISFLALNPIHF